MKKERNTEREKSADGLLALVLLFGLYTLYNDMTDGLYEAVIYFIVICKRSTQITVKKKNYDNIK